MKKIKIKNRKSSAVKIKIKISAQGGSASGGKMKVLAASYEVLDLHLLLGSLVTQA